MSGSDSEAPSLSKAHHRSASRSLSPSCSAPAISTDHHLTSVAATQQPLSTSTSYQDLFSFASLSSTHTVLTETTLLEQQQKHLLTDSQVPHHLSMLSAMSAFGQRLLGRGGNICKHSSAVTGNNDKPPLCHQRQQQQQQQQQQTVGRKPLVQPPPRPPHLTISSPLSMSSPPTTPTSSTATATTDTGTATTTTPSTPGTSTVSTPSSTLSKTASTKTSSPPSTSSSSWRRQRYIQFKRQQHQHKKHMKNTHLKKSLKSPRAILRAHIPCDASQSRRMDLLLLNESPKRDDLIRCAWNGCSPTNRPHVWRLLMGYEPLKFSTRNRTLSEKRQKYRQYIRVLYAPLGPVRFDRVPSVCTARVANVDDADEEDDLEDADIVSHHWDDPTTPTGSKDNGQFDVQQQQLASSNRKAATKIIEYSSFSAKTLRQIEMDLPRTHPHIPIFHVPQVRNPMRRILYIFGMLNPHKSYVQGMNEILSAILVVFLAERIPETECHDEHASAVGHQGMGKETEPLLLTEEQVRASQMSNNPILSFLKRRDFSNVCSSAKQLVDAEADAYWVYSELIARVDDNFCGDQAGILRRVNQMDMLVSKVDPTLSMHLRHNGNDFLQFGFRWINCLLMRELPLHLVVKYWDALLAHQRGIADFHVYFCAALLTRFTDTLVTLDFEECMMFLQHLPTRMWAEDDIDELLSQATVWEQSFNIDTYG